MVVYFIYSEHSFLSVSIGADRKHKSQRNYNNDVG